MASGTSFLAPRDLSGISIPDMLRSEGTSFSFEFFPPKNDESEQVLWEAIRHLEKKRPSFVSVTYGAGGSTRDRTVRVTRRIAEETTLLPMAHLTCVASSRAELRSVVGAYADAGIRNVMVLRGDPAGGLGSPWVAHPEGLDHADQLVSLVRALGGFTVGVAAFPDKHPESASLEQDADVLVAKQRAGADFAVTQMVFDVDNYLRLRDMVAARGGTLPIIPGLMPITSAKQITRMAELSGAALPVAVTSRLEAVGDDADAVREVGVEIATEHASRLMAEGAPGLHFYTMNRSTATLEVFANLGH
ncbi:MULTISPECIES: methylenetetrahydrofolate reductase [NAD(P)H] [Arsenicicoccus]|uniref:Methylenetetrahydrofolate reductase n=1 Tax=Arsenicicoccus bolidensis TaxID=229480 RepID=A0ABS9Q2D8_9MICO|nr:MULTISPECIES: methylenetetrahydrofolate reductase [NAD(P)H] [Arsenicicoccus]MCG7321253.1 methylenetetrahydrofolate reductase [NAD(P)H] [Arsenicicoccus bolidensis]